MARPKFVTLPPFAAGIPSAVILPPCLFKTATGVPCPSCGMTRAVLAMMQGDWPGAYSFHPLSVVFAAEMVILSLLLSRRRMRGLPLRPSQPAIDRLIAVNVVMLLGVWGARVASGWRG